MLKMLLLLLLLLCVGLSVAPPPPGGKEEAEAKDQMYDTDGLTSKQAQDQEYFRYITQIVGELEKDENFKHMVQNVSEEDVKSGKLADLLDHVGHNVRKKMDEVKRLEVEYQRDLIRRNKQHMSDPDTAYWNPVHHHNQETFEKEDFQKLLRRHGDAIDAIEEERHEEFKKHELEKEHERREAMKNMSEEERLAEKKKQAHHVPHDKIHEPGHKAQLEEVWDKSDGYDPENFNLRTFFHIHDKNADGYLDYYEAETLFLHDVDKLYNVSDPNVDLWERQEELQRMRTHMLKTMDKDGDGLVSMDEFMKETRSEDFEKDEEWKSVGEGEQLFTEAEVDEYERLLAEVKEETVKKNVMDGTDGGGKEEGKENI